MATKIIFLALWLNFIGLILCRKHHLVLHNEMRKDIEITNFGLLQGGMLSINVSNLSFPVPEAQSWAQIQKNTLVGFTLDMSGSYESASYAEDHTNGNCVLKPGSVGKNDSVATLYLTLNFTTKSLEVNRWGTKLKNLKIVPMRAGIDVCSDVGPPPAPQRPSGVEQSLARRRRQDPDSPEGAGLNSVQIGPGSNPIGKESGDSGSEIPADNSKAKPTEKAEVVQTPSPTSAPTHLISLPAHMKKKNNILYINTSFVVCIKNKSEQGLYSFFYHHCPTNPKESVNFSVSIVEKNVGPNYLSAGDIPLPTLYATMSLLFLCSAIYWIYYLCHQEIVFKIHYFMFFLALLKSLSLMFHAVDYHYIGKDGRPMEAFEILFYITYLTKGALLFGTIVLIGSGWAFIKPILSDQDKKLFWIVIPLQIFANVAYIITDTSEEGEAQYSMWKVMFVTVDIICCGAILYPVIWSIRHLQDAAQTDGKAAISLVKLKLFRSYYVLVVCYIYFSRIVVYILKVTMPFQFMWLDEFFFELATYVFYVLTAYKFRPGTDNPYLQLPSDDEDEDEIEMDEVLTETGHSEGLVRHVNATSRVKQRETNQSA